MVWEVVVVVVVLVVEMLQFDLCVKTLKAILQRYMMLLKD